MKKNKSLFAPIYFAFLGILIICVFFAVMYVRTLLIEYEANQPERIAAEQMDLLVAQAKADNIRSEYGLDSLVAGYYESDVSLWEKYTQLLTDPETVCTVNPGLESVGERTYIVKNGKNVLAFAKKLIG